MMKLLVSPRHKQSEFVETYSHSYEQSILFNDLFREKSATINGIKDEEKNNIAVSIDSAKFKELQYLHSALNVNLL